MISSRMQMVQVGDSQPDSPNWHRVQDDSQIRVIVVIPPIRPRQNLSRLLLANLQMRLLALKMKGYS